MNPKEVGRDPWGHGTPEFSSFTPGVQKTSFPSTDLNKIIKNDFSAETFISKG